MEVVARFFGTTAITSSRMVVQHLTLWVGFFGAVLASSRGKLLSLSSSNLFEPESSFSIKHFIAKSTSLIILISLFWGSLQLVTVEYQYPVNISPLISRWFAQSIMPISLMLMSVILFFKSYSSLKNRFALLISILLFLSIVSIPQVRESSVTLWFSFFSIIFSLLYGLPIFLGLGGIAALLFWFDWTPLSAISAETYRIVVSPTLPTIPLFTIAGFLLAESKSSIRLLSLFQALFGWIPGGTPIVLVIICGFFTAITGGSGVTILALGGLLMPMLIKDGFSKDFSLGLITVSGSIGLLFPPSLPLIIYGVTAGVSIKSIFLGGIIPGLLILVIVASWAIFSSKRQSVAVYGFKINNIKSALIESKWEIAIPFIIMFGIFGGYMTLVETAAISALYVLFITVVIYRDISFSKVGNILIDCCALIGGVLIILGVAMGLTSYIIDAEVPMTLLEWVKTNISSKYIFLILLNVFLLIVGCMMDIFSATIIVVPLIKPIAAYFGIDPIHLAIIFIANLELGYLTPPVGMNLFLSAYRFDESMKSVYTSTMPFYFVMLFCVILITYFPILSTWLVGF
ncbi:MAG: TRAP transporter large permease subunit [Candidatus Neomarinimicrobiota bacterium]|nr:TRAP transporter large permease subunit [Candidatus Neomarinimicrobiota bacterium]